METLQQGAFDMKGLVDEGGAGLAGLARTLLEAGVNEVMSACVSSSSFEQNVQ